ncbi:MAG: autotransporter-associated beta strand repeat-containing protein [Verrucomicrobia bacterium]|nr:autotransporter-associated beta strand repeat-containing protein [Verrucomicrobiota bacterium]
MKTHALRLLNGLNDVSPSQSHHTIHGHFVLRVRCLLAAAFASLVAVEEVRAQTNYFWTNPSDGLWSVGGNWTNELNNGSAPANGGGIDYSIFIEQGQWPRHFLTIDTLTDNKFTLNQFVNGAYGTNYVTNAAAGTYLVFSTNSSGSLPQILQNSTNVLRFAIGIMLTNDLMVAGTNTGTVYFDKDLAGTNALTKAGSYTLTLSVANSFSGLVTIQNGEIQLNHKLALQNAPIIDVLSGGQLIINATGNYTNAISIVGTGDGNGAIRFAGSGERWSGPIALTGNARIGLYSTANQTDTNAGVISGTGNLTFYARGSSIKHIKTLVLEATNTYEGTTTITTPGTTSSATLIVRLAGNNLLPTDTVLIMNNTTTNMAQFDLGGFDQTLAGLTTLGAGVSNVVANTSNALSRLTINNAADYTYGGFLTGNFQVIKSGLGVQALSGTNTYLGGTIVSNGLLRFDIAQSLPASGTITLASNTAAVAYNVAGGLASVLFPKIVNIASTRGIIALTTNSAADTLNFLTYANLFVGAAENITNAGAYTPFQSGGGTLTNYFNLGGGVPGAVLTFTNDIIDGYNGGNLSVVTIGGSAAARAVVELTGANTYNGGTFLNGSVLSVGSDNNLGAASSAITFAGGVLRITGTTFTNLDSRPVNWGTFNGGFDIADAANVFTITNAIAGSTGLLKLGSGALVLSGANTYSGNTLVQGGVLRGEWGAGIPLTDNLVLNGGVWETASGLVTNNLGSGAGQIQLPGSTGGFSAITAPLTVNLGGAGTTVQWGSTYFNPSVLVLNETTANQTLNFINPLDFSGAVRTVAVNAVTATLGGGILNSSGTAGLVKTGAGTLILTNTTPMALGRSLAVSGGTLNLGDGTTTIISGGTILLSGESTLNINGSVVSSNGVQVGSTAGSRAIMTLGANGSLLFTNTAACIQIGMAGATGAFYQTGGVIINSPTVTTGEGVFAPGYGGYGYYRITDGLLVNNGRFSLGGAQTTSIGIFEQFGGVVTNKEWVIWRKGPAAQINLFGGEFNANNSQGFVLNYDGTNHNVLNIAGATVNLAMASSLPLNLGRQPASTGIVNLLSGTLTVNQIMATAVGQTFFNFDGGILRVNPATTLAANFMTNALAGAYIYSGGAIINVESNIITIAQALLAPTDKGISSITTNGLAAGELSGYIGTPIVRIIGGSGVGASAIAQIDLATGVLTNIFISSAGSGYQAGDILTITLIGGGNTNVVLGSYTLADNANTGGLTKNGYGAIILTGTNSYGGSTVINAGGLVLSNVSTSISANTLTLAGITSSIGPTNILEQSFLDWLAGRVTGVVTGAVLVAANSDSNLVFSGTMTNVFLGGLSNAVYTGGATWADNTLRLGNGPGTFTYGSVIGTGTNLVIGPVGGNPLSVVILTGINTHDATLLNAGAVAVSNDFSFGAVGATLTFNGGNLIGFGITNVVIARSLIFSNNVTIGGSNVTFTGSANLGGATRTLTITNTLTSFEGVISNGGLVKEGSGTLMLTYSNNYAAGTLLNAGTLSVSNANALGRGDITFNGGGLAGFGRPLVTITQLLDFTGNATFSGSNLTFNKTVDLGGGVRMITVNTTTSIFSSVVQNGGIIKGGSGMLVLDSGNTYGAGTFLTGGFIKVSENGALGTGPAIAYSTGKRYILDGVTLDNAFFIYGGNPDAGRGIIEGTNNSTVNGPITITASAGSGGHFAAFNGLLILNGPITSSVPVTIRDGNVRLAGGGDYTLLKVDDGTTSLGADNGIATNALLALAGVAATIADLNGYNQTLRGLTAAGTFAATITNNQATFSLLTLRPEATSNYLFVGSINGPVALTLNGPGTQTIAGTSAWSGPTLISAGTLQIGNGGTGGSFGSGPVTNQSTLIFNSSGVNALDGIVSGNGVLIQAGTGVTVLNNTNTYTGNTILSDGILQADFGAGLSGGSRLVISGGTFSAVSGTITNPLGNTAAHIQFVDGVAGGFSGYNTPLTVNINNDGSTQMWGSAGFNLSALILNGTLANANLTFVNGLNLNGATRVIAVNATNMGIAATVSGVINNSGGSADLRKTGPGVLALTGNNVFDSSIFVEDGVLRAEWGAGIPNTVNLVLTGGVWESASGLIDSSLGASAGLIQLPGSTGGFSAVTAPLTVNLGGGAAQIQWGNATFNPSVLLLNAASANTTLTFTNGLDLNGADRTIAVNSSFNNPVTIRGVITNNSGTAGLIKAGPGLLMLTGANGWNGNTFVREGVLRADRGAGLSTLGTLVLTGGVWETASGSITANIGAGAGEIQLPGSTGGFSAVTQPLNVNLGGGATVQWGSANFNPDVFVLNAGSATELLTVQNALDFGNATRTIAVNANTAIVSSILVSDTNRIGLIKTGSGALVLNNSSLIVISNGFFVQGGRLILNGELDGGLATSDIAPSAGQTARVTIGTNLTLGFLRIGVSGVGALIQTGGVLNISPAESDNSFALGRGANGYGYYRLDEGQLFAGRIGIGYTVGSTPAYGVFDMFGGTVVPSGYVMLTRAAGGYGLLNIFGGTFLAGTNGARDFYINFDQVGVGVVSIRGSGILDASHSISNRSLNLNDQTGGTGIVNVVNGGTLIADRIRAGSTGLTLLNFNGGTLIAHSNTPSASIFLQGLNGSYIYSGGLTILNDSDITIGQSFLAPTGYGLATITTNGLTLSDLDGYIGAPVVMISGGSGAGATAIAQIDQTSGILTNILVTNPGFGYDSGDTLTVTLIGGGNTNVILGNYSLTANATTGGLIKNGVGTLVLAGNSNTFGGPITINAGTLQFASSGALAFSAITNNATLIYGQTVTNTWTSDISGSGNLVVLGSGSGQLNLAGTNSFGGGMAVTNGLLMFTHFGALPSAGSIVLDSGVVGLNTNNVAANLLPRLAASPTGFIALFLTNANDTIDFAVGGYSGLGLASAENLTYQGVFTPYVTNGTKNWWFGAVGGTTFTLTNLINDGVNPSPLLIGTNTLAGMLGVVALRPAQPNTYSGGTFLRGGVLNITNDNALGMVPGTASTNITFVANATLQFSAGLTLNVNRAFSMAGGTGTFDTLANTVFIPGTIGGDGSMNKIGSGALVLDSNTDTVQFLDVNAGTLWLSNTLFTATGAFANGVIIVGDSATDNNATLIVDTNSAVGMTANANNPFVIGNFGSGNTLIVTNGGVVYAGTTNYPGFWMGNQAGSSSNLAIVIGTNSLIASSGRVLVGDDGSFNTMMILNGGTVSNANYFEVGRTATAGTNLLLVSGEGSLLTNTSAGIIIGESGVGNMAIFTNGAQGVTAGALIVGYGIGAHNNMLEIISTNTVVKVAGEVQIGGGSTMRSGGPTNNVLMILDGGTLINANWFTVGRFSNASDNLLLVSGEGALLSNTANGIIVGNFGRNNTAIITNGASVVTTGRFVLGYNIDGTGNSAFIGGTGTLLQVNTGGIQVGTNASFNTLVIGNGANVISSGGVLVGGAAAAGNNSVRISDTGTVLTVSGNAYVGNLGSNNSLSVAVGGLVTNSNGRVFVGYGASSAVSSNNQLVINGGTWVNTNMNGDSYVGYYGFGNSLLITNGGVMDVTAPSGNDLMIGMQPVSSNNSVLVSGSGSIFTFNRKIFVGDDSSSNRFTVAAGGTVNNNNGQLVVGDGASASTVSTNNQLVIDGGTWVNTNVTADLQIGNYGVGNSLIIANGGVMRLGTATVGSVDFLIGNQAVASNNSMLVSGAGSVFVFTNTIYVGNAGSSNAMTVDGGAVTNSSTFSVGGTGSRNLLTITNGGKVNSVTFNVGESAGALGNVAIITGNGSVLTNRGSASNQDMRIGSSGGNSSLLVLDGGAVGANRYVLIGYNAGSSNNSVLVSGTNSLLSAKLDIRVGSSGPNNTLTIANSGRVFGQQDFIIGYFTGNNSNRVVVTDPGSVLTNTRNLYLGYYTGTFDNAMVITNGGQVVVGGFSTIGNGITAGGLSSNNSVLVSGTGSFWQTVGALTVGNFGVGNSLTVNNGGAVQAGSIAVGSNGSFSLLSVGSGAAVTNLGLLQVGAVGFASNSTLIVSGANTRFDSAGEIWLGATDAHHNVMQVLNGAMVTNSSFFLMGRRAGSGNNTLVVDNASLFNGRVIAVGGSGADNVAIFTNGAQVVTPQFDVSRSTGSSNNSAYVSSAGTLIQVGGDVRIGAPSDSSFNLLQVDNSSVLRAGSNVYVGGVATNLGIGNQFVLSGGATGIIGGDLVISTNSVLRNLSSGTVKLAGSFDNLSTNFAQNDFSGVFIFNGGTTRTQLVEVGSTAVANMAATNFMFGMFQVGDPVTGSNAFVRTVDARSNTSGAGTEFLAASNLVVATSGSTLDLNSARVFAYNVANTGTIQQVVAGSVGRLDIVNTFTNRGNLYAMTGGILQFSNAFINGNGGLIGLVGGTFTNFLTGSVLTNQGTIGGGGLVNPVIGNGPTGQIAATNTGAGGVLTLVSGFTNSGTGPVNAGLLAALGGGAELQINQSFTNAGTIWMNNDAAVVRLTDSSSNLVNAAGGTIYGQGTLQAFLDNSGVVSNGNSGTLSLNLPVMNENGGVVQVNGAGSVLSFAGVVTNALGGVIRASDSGRLLFNAGLTNHGRLAFGSSVNPSTAIITGTLLMGSTGVITMTHSNDTLVVRGDFVNGSTDTNNFNMRIGTLVFGGTSPTVTNTFEVASTNKGYYLSGFDKNMALGTLKITNHIEFVNNINNGGGLGTNECLYVDVLHLFNGATLKLSQLTIYVGIEFIYEDGNGTKVLTGAQGDAITAANKDVYGLANVFLDSGGQIVFVPEPSTGVLMGLGMAALAGWRRRRKSRCVDSDQGAA